MTLNIQEIINDKITGMLENKEIQEKIETTIENVLLKTISDSISNYDIRNILEAKMKKEVSESVELLDLTGYTNKIIQQIGQIIEQEQNKDLAEKIKNEYNHLFINKKEKITQEEIISAFEEYIKNNNDDWYDKTIYWDVTLKNEYGSSIWVDFKISLSSDFGNSYFDETYKITLTNNYKEPDKFHIVGIYEKGDFREDLTKKIKLGYLNSFEKLLINAFYNETPIVELEEEQNENQLGDY